MYTHMLVYIGLHVFVFYCFLFFPTHCLVFWSVIIPMMDLMSIQKQSSLLWQGSTCMYMGTWTMMDFMKVIEL